MTNEKSVTRPNAVHIDQRIRVADGYIKVDEVTMRHGLYDGGMSPPLKREIINRGHAVAVMPYDPVRDEVVMVEQFRVAAWQAFGEATAQVRAEASPGGAWLLECIAGIVEDGENPEEVAIRESFEEAGCVVDNLIHARSFLTSPGCLTESVSFYGARTDASNAGGIHGLASEGEDIRVVRMTLEEALRMLDDGEINNAFTLIALEWLKSHWQELRQRWT